jgi:hypothetical protein
MRDSTRVTDARYFRTSASNPHDSRKQEVANLITELHHGQVECRAIDVFPRDLLIMYRCLYRAVSCRRREAATYALNVMQMLIMASSMTVRGRW